ncbi:hypothetical protein NONO_c38010 [Nocardia nova SH22a]|uniref:DUF4440 domain-containing protein n=1 Tax=Nocardia nova SH22a TaxID=1415166 RepID=W5TGT9_9NOCA|nr:nuclear transport factor 2 family protein [Nocardia nova]AHH18585.1 hypothetical protein NONO_c38010 [Nocardia nova SH22a]
MTTTRSVPDLERTRIAAMVAGDIDTLATLLNDSCVYIHSTGAVDTGQSYLDKLRRGEFGYDAIDVDEMSTITEGDVTVIAFRMSADIRVGDQHRHSVSRCTAVWSAPGSLICFQATPLGSAADEQ